jgi:small GTP-binding protein
MSSGPSTLAPSSDANDGDNPTPSGPRGPGGAAKSIPESQLSIKILLTGDNGCGKTCLLIRQTARAFPVEYIPTIFDSYEYQAEAGAGRHVQVNLWDTKLVDHPDRLRVLSYPQTDVFLLCFSLADGPQALVRAQTFWAEELAPHLEQSRGLILVGLKSELRDQKGAEDDEADMVTTIEGRAAAARLGARSYRECSALIGEGVDELFAEAVEFGIGPRPTPSSRSMKRARSRGDGGKACSVQ